jgi:Tol biopolymer transport system component
MKLHLAHGAHARRLNSFFYLVALLLFWALPVTLKAQSPGTNILVSANAANTGSGTGAALAPNIPRSSVSDDGRFIVFIGGPDLVTDGGGQGGLLVRDTVSNTTTLVSPTVDLRDYAVSADGRFVAYTSSADDPALKDANRAPDIFVRDLVARTTQLVSVNLSGTSSTNLGPESRYRVPPRISADGRYVLFVSPARDLVPNDGNDSFDLYLRDLHEATTTLVSIDRSGKATGSRTRLSFDGSFGFESVMSADGRYVAFTSYASDMTADDTVCYGTCDGLNSLPDVFVRDVKEGTTTLVSVNRAGTAGGNEGAITPSISANGRRVAFRSSSTDLVANASTPQFNIYARDLDARTTTLVSVNRFGTDGGSTPSGHINAFSPMISPDGRFVAFESSATDMVANKTDFLTHDVFLRDLAAGTTTLVSVNLAGTDSTSPRGGPSSRFRSSFVSDISADGRFISFESNAPDLAANDTNGTYDVFVRDVAAGLTTLASVNRAGTGSAAGESFSSDLSADGRLVAYMNTADDIVENDHNGFPDVFAHFIRRPGSVQLAAADLSVGEGDTRVLVTVTRAGDASLPATVTLRTVDDPAAVPCDPTIRRPDGTPYPRGQAYARCDYATTIETISWAAGDVQPKTVAVPLTDDAHVEGDETFRVVLSGNAGATLGAQPAATITIRDNDTTGQANPLDQTSFFVRQHYLDFLSREPEPDEPWSDVLNNCPTGDTRCDRITVSAAFFGSPESRLKGRYVFTFYRVSFDRLPTYDEIVADMQQVTGATPEEVYRRRAQFASSFAGRQEFGWIYRLLTDEQYVDRLLGRYSLQQITTPDPRQPDTGAKVVLTRADLVAGLRGNTLDRAQILRAVVDSDEVGASEFNRAFVAMQYYGYLRRTPENEGYEAWLRVINQNPNNIRIMVNGFLNSTEYRLRFGQP